MKKWKLSRYTSLTDDDSGDLLLHNTFMGAIARVPRYRSQDFLRYIKQGVLEHDLKDQALKELCEEGFLVPTDLDEQKIVSEVLYKERELSGYNIIILPHEDCNFRCDYCYESFERGKMTADVMSGLKTFVDLKSKEFKRLSISWFGGEPLLGRDVIYKLSDSFIKSCALNDVSYSSGMSTNGYLLTPDTVSALLKYKVRSFQVTLDGPEPTHDSKRRLAGGGGTYRKILNNLLAMRNRDSDFSVRIRVNFNEDSISLMEEFFSEIAPLFANDPRFSVYFRPIGRWGGPNDSTIDTCDSNASRQHIFNLFEKHSRFGFSDQAYKESLMSHGYVCYASRESSIIVGADGKAYKCTVAFKDPRNHVGKLSKDGQLILDTECWNKWVHLDSMNTSECNSCSFSPACQGRMCPLSSMDNGRPPCPITKQEYQSMVKHVASGLSKRKDAAGEFSSKTIEKGGE